MTAPSQPQPRPQPPGPQTAGPEAAGRSRQPDPLSLPPTFGVRTASEIFGVGKNKTYALIRQGKYPIPVIDIDGRYRCSRVDLLRRLGYPEDVILGQAS